MKAQEFQKLIKKYLLNDLEHFNVKGGLLFLEPIDFLLKAFCFESSSFNKYDFIVTYFIQPLYVLKDFVTLTYGFRFGVISDDTEKWWKLDKNNEEQVMNEVKIYIIKEGIPFLNSINCYYDFVDYLKKEYGKMLGVHQLEAISYSLILSNDIDEAKEYLNKLKIKCQSNKKIEWVREVEDRGDRMLNTLNTGYENAVELLKDWRMETIKNLRLEKFAKNYEI